MDTQAKAPARRAIDVIAAAESALAAHSDHRTAIYAVVSAILPKAERDTVARVREADPDQRTDAEFAQMRAALVRILDGWRFTAPEMLWYRVNTIGNVVLRQSEIAAVMGAEVQP